MKGEQLDTQKIIGKRIINATSSLKNFSIELENDLGLRIDAAEGPTVQVSVVPKNELPVEKEAVCSVDWSWIYNATIKNVRSTVNTLTLDLDPTGPITVTAANWQGSAFLGFQPYKPVARV